MDGKIMLKCIWRKSDGCSYTSDIWLRTGKISWLFRAVFLNRWAAARYRAQTSIIPGREGFTWNMSF